MSYQKGFERCSPIEPQKKLSIESWLFNRNPYIGWKKSPYNWVACHRQKKTNQGPFSLLNWGWSIAYVVFMILEVTWRLRQRTRWSLSLSWVRWFWGNKMLNWFPVKGPGRFSCFFSKKDAMPWLKKKSLVVIHFWSLTQRLYHWKVTETPNGSRIVFQSHPFFRFRVHFSEV